MSRTVRLAILFAAIAIGIIVAATMPVNADAHANPCGPYPSWTRDAWTHTRWNVCNNSYAAEEWAEQQAAQSVRNTQQDAARWSNTVNQVYQGANSTVNTAQSGGVFNCTQWAQRYNYNTGRWDNYCVR